MHHGFTLTAEEALAKLKAGNQIYMTQETPSGNISPRLRLKTCREGQEPYAIILTCSDSRVIPEAIFNGGIGDIFVIRTAGNTASPYALACIEYGVDHLGAPLVVVLGHDHCGAVQAALGDPPGGFIQIITDEIRATIGDERDPLTASRMNVLHNVDTIRNNLVAGRDGMEVCGAIYHLEDGSVEFL